MPKVSEQHREARRDQIVDAALRSFAAKGFQGASMADIIAEAGLSAGAIYGHFDGKRELALAVAQRILGNRMQEIAGRIADDELPPPSAMARAMMTGLARDISDTGMLVQLWGEAVTQPELTRMIGPVFAEVQAVMGPYLERWAREHRGANAQDAVAWSQRVIPVFLGLCQGYIVQSALLPGFDAERYFSGVAALLDG